VEQTTQPQEHGPDGPGRINQDVEAVERDEADLHADVERLELDVREVRRAVEVSVNKHLVRLPDQRVTGLQILEAAKTQGVNIDLDFQLWEVLGEGRERQIGDTDEITVREGSRFKAIAPDDNS
jgi:hypothetical protein